MKKLLLLIGTFSSFSFLLYTNWPAESHERLLYSIVDLGRGVRPVAVNNRGAILLETQEGASIRSSDDSVLSIPLPQNVPHRVSAMNDLGEVAGATDPSEEGGREGRAFIWSESKGLKYLPASAQAEEAEEFRILGAYALRNDGLVGVVIRGASGHRRGILTQDGLKVAASSRTVPKMTPNGSLLSRRQILTADNDSEILPREIERPVTLSISEDFVLYPTGLNDHSEVIGFAFSDEHEYRRARSSMRAWAGASRGDPPRGRFDGFPFVRIDGRYLNLGQCISPESGWEIEWPSDINNRGEIVGVGLHLGVPSGFLLVPIPSQQIALN